MFVESSKSTPIVVRFEHFRRRVGASDAIDDGESWRRVFTHHHLLGSKQWIRTRPTAKNGFVPHANAVACEMLWSLSPRIVSMTAAYAKFVCPTLAAGLGIVIANPWITWFKAAVAFRVFSV